MPRDPAGGSGTKLGTRTQDSAAVAAKRGTVPGTLRARRTAGPGRYPLAGAGRGALLRRPHGPRAPGRRPGPRARPRRAAAARPVRNVAHSSACRLRPGAGWVMMGSAQGRPHQGNDGLDEGAEAGVGEEAAVGERPAGGGVGAAEGGGGCHRNWARAGRSSRVSDDTRATSTRL